MKNKKNKSRFIRLNYLNFIIPCFAILFFFSCKNDGKRNIEEYYYPIDKMDNGIVYEYHPVNNKSLPVEYWHFVNAKTDTGTYFGGQYYDHTFSVKQFFTAEVVSNGIIMKDYFIYGQDSLGQQIQQTANIEYGNSFPFEVKDETGVFLFKIRWDDLNVELTRNQRFKGDTEYSFKNKKYDCVEFSIKENVDDYNDGHLETLYDVKEVYAKGIGLVYYKKEIGKDFILEYELADTYSMKEFEKKHEQARQ